MRVQSSSEGEQATLLGFAVLSPTYGHDRPHGRSIPLLTVTRRHRLEPVEYSRLHASEGGDRDIPCQAPPAPFAGDPAK